MSEFYEEGDFYTGPALSVGAVEEAESLLGVTLPTSYVELLTERNGGTPRKRCFPTSFPTSWAPDHIAIDAIHGIGGKWGIDGTAGLGSRELVREWGYPDIGVVICSTPSGGHDTVMLDYTECGPHGEPTVVYVDEDRIPRQIAASFRDFIDALIECPAPDE